MKRGDIYYINSLYTEEGCEQRAGRPAVIVSNDMCNEFSQVVEVVYLTTQPKKDLPTHVFIRSSNCPSTVLCEQISSVSKDRIGEYIGKLTKLEQLAVDNALAISLGIDFEQPEPVVKMREPTEEELQKLIEERQKQPAEIKAVKEPNGPTSEELAGIFKEAFILKAERDVYKKMYDELLERIMKEAKM